MASDSSYSFVPGEDKDHESLRHSHETEGGDVEMAAARRSIDHPTDGEDGRPLLKDGENRRMSGAEFENGDAEGRSMLHHSRRPTFRSISPVQEDAEQVTRRKYLMAGGFLLLSLASFVVQTETAVYIQHELGWDKPYCML